MTLVDTDKPSSMIDQAQTPLYECMDPSNPGYHRQSRRPISHEPPRVLYSEEQRSQMFQQCHSDKPGHWGAGKTWITLNMHYPGHGIPFSRVQTLVAECPKCQKYRISDSGLVIAPKRTVLQPPDPWNIESSGSTATNELVNKASKLMDQMIEHATSSTTTSSSSSDGITLEIVLTQLELQKITLELEKLKQGV